MAFYWLNLGLYVRVLGKQVEQLASANQLKWFSIGEFKSGFSIATGRDQNAFGCPFIHHCAIQIADSTDAYCVLVPFGLNYDFPSEYRTRIVSNTIHSSITRSLRQACLQAHCPE